MNIVFTLVVSAITFAGEPYDVTIDGYDSLAQCAAVGASLAQDAAQYDRFDVDCRLDLG